MTFMPWVRDVVAPSRYILQWRHKAIQPWDTANKNVFMNTCTDATLTSHMFRDRYHWNKFSNRRTQVLGVKLANELVQCPTGLQVDAQRARLAERGCQIEHFQVKGRLELKRHLSEYYTVHLQ